MNYHGPQRKVALLVGGTEYGETSNYATLPECGPMLNEFENEFKAANFLVERVESNSTKCGTSNELLKAITAAGERLFPVDATAGRDDAADNTLAVFYYVGHGVEHRDSPIGQCMVTSEGDLVPVSHIHNLFHRKPPGWIVMITDACRNFHQGDGKATEDSLPNEKNRDPPSSSSCLHAYSCYKGKQAWECAYSKSLLTVWRESREKSVLTLIEEAMKSCPEQNPQLSSTKEIDAFRKFSFHKQLAQDRLPSPDSKELFGCSLETREELLDSLMEHGVLRLVGGPGEGKTVIARLVGQLFTKKKKNLKMKQKMSDPLSCRDARSICIDLRSCGAASGKQTRTNVKNEILDQLKSALSLPTSALNDWDSFRTHVSDIPAPLLLFLDNAERAMESATDLKEFTEALQDLHNSERVLLIIASRRTLRDVSDDVTVYPQAYFSQLHAKELLFKASRNRTHGDSPQEREDFDKNPHIDDLIARLRCNPMLLKIMGSLVGEHSIKDWQEALKQVALVKILDYKAGEPISADLKAWFKSALKKPPQLDFLYCLSVFAGSFSLAGALAVQTKDLPGGQDAHQRDMTLRVTLAELEKLSMVQCDDSDRDDPRYELHPAVREVVQRLVPEQLLGTSRKAFLQWMMTREHEGPGRQLATHHPRSKDSNPVLCSHVMKHEHLNFAEVRVLCEGVDGKLTLNGGNIAWTADDLCQLVMDGTDVVDALAALHQFNLLKALMPEVLKQCHRVLQADHPIIAQVKLTTARVEAEVGNLEHAIAIIAELLELTLTEEQLFLAKSLRTYILSRSGKLIEALESQLEVVKNCEEALGLSPAHQNDRVGFQVLLPITNSATMDDVTICKCMEPIKDLSTCELEAKKKYLNAIANVAAIFHDLHVFELALRYKRFVFEQYTLLYSAEDPSTLEAADNLAATLALMKGTLQEAIDLKYDAVAKWKKVAGSNHASTIRSQANLLSIILKAELSRDVEPLCEELLRALESYKASSGAHRAVAYFVRSKLVFAWFRLGYLAIAKTLAEDMLHDQLATFGIDNAETWECMEALATICFYRGEYDEAFPLMWEVHEKRQKSSDFGATHSSTQNSAQNLQNIAYMLHRSPTKAQATVDACAQKHQAYGACTRAAQVILESALKRRRIYMKLITILALVVLAWIISLISMA